MNEKQQIEEMARVLRPLTLCSNCLSSLSRDKKRDGGCYKPIGYECSLDRDILKYCESLYNAGYIKQSENTIELPCKVGDKVWCISNYTKPKEFQITILTISENHYSFVIEANKGVYKHYCDKDSVGRYVFFTKKEAEKALAKMKGGTE